MRGSYLITGGTGSYGNVFVDHILRQEPERVVIYSRDEQKQEAMARRLDAWGVDHRCLRFFIGDVRDRDRLEFAMHSVDTVIHAAALKIVPTAEYNPTECIATNVGGAENVVKSAIKAGVRRVLALSTDKAVNPVNLYGASKLAAEKIFIAANSLAAGKTLFSVMRYGNVVGSRGSVIPLFKTLARENKPLTITDKSMTRFWITLPEAVNFSLRCLSKMRGREIFVPKIPSMRIVDLAGAISNSPIEVIGIRPGEKLHECLITEDEARTTWEHDDHYIVYPSTARDIAGDRVPVGFRYTSDTNSHWLTPDELAKVIQ